MRIRTTIFITLLSAINCLSQNKAVADSCLKLLSQGKIDNDSVYFTLVSRVAFNQTEADSAIYYSDLLIEEAVAKHHEKFIAKGYYCKAIGLLKQSNFDKALEALFLCINEANEINDEKQIAQAYSLMGNAYNSLKNYEEAIKCYRVAVLKFDKLKNVTGLAGCHLNLGSNYFAINKFDSSLVFFNVADSLYNKVLKSALSGAYAKGNIGIILAQKKNYGSARVNLTDACNVLKANEHFQVYILFKIWLSHIEQESNNLPSALEYAEECIRIAQANNLPEQMRDAYEQLSSVYEAMGRYREANEALKNHYAYRDSIVNTETITKIANLRTEFEVGQKQAELDKMTEKEQFTTRLFWLVSAMFTVVASLLFVVYRNYKKNKLLTSQLALQKQELELANQTKDKLFSVISHDLRGPIGSVGNLVQLSKEAMDNGDLRDLGAFLLMMGKSIENVETLLYNLLHWSVTQRGVYQTRKETIDFNKLVQDVIDIYHPIALAKNVHLKYATHTREFFVNTDMNSWAVILRNLINNAIKFTHSGGKVEIRALLDEQTLIVEVADSGVGMDHALSQSLFSAPINEAKWGTHNEKGMGIGLSLVKDFVEINKGTIQVESEMSKGTTFRVKIPL